MCSFKLGFSSAFSDAAHASLSYQRRQHGGTDPFYYECAHNNCNAQTSLRGNKIDIYMPHKVEKKPKETVFPSARGECQVINTQETNWGIRGKFKRETDKKQGRH